MMSIAGATIARHALAYQGVPFRHLGRDRTGLDCVGLLILTSRNVGLIPADFDFTGYGRRPNGHRLVRHLVRCGLRRYGGRLKPGMFATFQFGREPMHLAIIAGSIDALRLVHSDARAGGVVTHNLDHSWLRRLNAVWHFPGVSY